MQHWRQGDVMIRHIDGIPRTAEPHDGHILAEGVATGHTHAIEPPTAGRMYAAGERLYLRAESKFRVVHPEHGPIALDPGCYEFWRQREYIGHGSWHRHVSD